MKRLSFAVLVIGVVLGLGNADKPTIKVTDAWVRPIPVGAFTTAAYMVIENLGEVPDTLLSASSDAVNTVELHTVTMKDGMMQMRPVKGGIRIPPHGIVRMKPGGYHLMFIDPKQAIIAGEEINLTLTFAKAGTVKVRVKVEQRDVTLSGHEHVPGMPAMSGNQSMHQPPAAKKP